MTRGQRRALDQLWSQYVLDCGADFVDLDTVFGRHALRVLEIGFGNGESLADMASTHPHTDFLGIEVHRPGIGHLLNLLGISKLTNVRVMCADALTVLEAHIRDQTFDRVQLFFPDPWPKRRHHKRRIIQTNRVGLMIDKLKLGGTIHLATDWPDYAEQMLEVLSATPALENCAHPGRFSERPLWRPVTKFERRGLALGHKVRDLVFRRRLSSANS
jgi:tRNA (guanine-N7-)-methyltransferase